MSGFGGGNYGNGRDRARGAGALCREHGAHDARDGRCAALRSGGFGPVRAARPARRPTAAGIVRTGRRRAVADRQSLAVRAGGSLRSRCVPYRRTASRNVRGSARPRALPGAARLRRRARGRRAPHRVPRRLPAENAAHRARTDPSRRVAARGGARPARTAIPGRHALRRGSRRLFHNAAAHCLARSGRGERRGRRRGAHPPARPGGGIPAHGRAQPPGLSRAR